MQSDCVPFLSFPVFLVFFVCLLVGDVNIDLCKYSLHNPTTQMWLINLLLATSCHFRLYSKEYLTHLHKFQVDWFKIYRTRKYSCILLEHPDYLATPVTIDYSEVMSESTTDVRIRIQRQVSSEVDFSTRASSLLSDHYTTYSRDGYRVQFSSEIDRKKTRNSISGP